MDIEKLVKDGARAIWSVSYDHDYESVPFDEAWSRARYTHLRQRLEQQSRAVLAIALKAAAEEADDRALYPLIAAEMAGVVRDPNLVDQVSRVLAAGWRGNPNMSGDDRDFMPGPMRRRHDDRTATACEYIATAILAHVKTIE